MSIRKVRVRRGRWAWQARVMINGRRRSVLRASQAEAKAAEADLLSGLGRERTDEAARLERPASFREALRFYAVDLEQRGKGPDTVARARQVETAIRETVPGLLDRPVSALTTGDLYLFKTARDRAGIRPGTINRDLRVVRALLNQVRPEFRFPGAAFAKEDHTRVRLLTPEQEAAVFTVMREPVRSMARLAALTLMRLSEVRLLRREQVDLAHGLLVLPRTKTAPRQVQLSSAATSILRDAITAHDRAWVFPNPDGAAYSRVHVSRVFRAAAQKIGLVDFHFHDLRHHGATVALNAGFSGQVVKDLGGWKSEAMLRRYAALTDETLKLAAEAVAAHGTGQRLRLVKRTPVRARGA